MFDELSFKDMVLDIHAHTALTGLFVYGNSYDDVYRYERHIVFPKILAQNCEDFNATNTIYNADCKKSGSVRRHMTTYLSHEVNTYTLEVSLLGFEDKEKRQIIPYTDDLYARVGRNISRAMWDYYKIVGTIPLEDSSDEESGIPKPSVKPNVFKNFNMDRLREVERQRQETAQTFDDEKDAAVSVKPKISIAAASNKSMSKKKKDFVRLNSEKFRRSLSIDLDDLDGLSNLSVKNDNSSSGDNDYSDASGGKNSDKVLTPIVSLEMDDNAYHSYMKAERQQIADLDDDVDFFFNPSSSQNNTSKSRTIQRQNSVDGFGLFRTNSQRAMAGKSLSTKQYFSSPLASLQISKLGAPDDTDLLAQTLGKSSIGLDAIHQSGFTSEL